MPSGDFLILKWKVREVMNGRKFGDKGDSGSFLYVKRNRKVWSLEASKWKIEVMEGRSVTIEIQYDHSLYEEEQKGVVTGVIEVDDGRKFSDKGDSV